MSTISRYALPALALAAFTQAPHALAYTVTGYPILEALQANGQTLSENTLDWMKKWKGMDLDDSSKYDFKELSGSTSINLKIRKLDTTDENGYKSRGSFVPRNGAANPDTEIAYFNLAAILGWDGMMRPAARYELGTIASKKFKSLINSTPIKGKQRLENKAKILAAISTGNPLKGCVKGKKDDTEVSHDLIANTSGGINGEPKSSHSIIQALQCGNSQPSSTKETVLKTGYTNDALTLAREYSVLMTLDSIFQQWDRYSGGNVVIRKDKEGKAHFYATDNGGADVSKTTGWTERNLGWFSRYDKQVIAKLRDLLDFLENPSKGYLGYTNAETFVVDLGLYSQVKSADYVERIKRNLKLLMARVKAMEAKCGNAAYLP